MDALSALAVATGVLIVLELAAPHLASPARHARPPARRPSIGQRR
jgi:hypothetical protein